MLVITHSNLPLSSSITDDPSGRWRQAQQALADNPRTARLAAVGVLGAELLALAAACALQAIYQQAYDAWMDDQEVRRSRTPAQCESLRRVSHLSLLPLCALPADVGVGWQLVGASGPAKAAGR